MKPRVAERVGERVAVAKEGPSLASGIGSARPLAGSYANTAGPLVKPADARHVTPRIFQTAIVPVVAVALSLRPTTIKCIIYMTRIGPP